MLHENSIIMCSEDLISCDIDGDTVILSIEKGKYYGLNSTSSHIWTLLQSPQSVHDLCKVLTEEFLVPQEKCTREVLSFLNILVLDNLIKVVHEED